MKTTRAMLVIGIVMLVLAVIVAQGLRPDEPATVTGPVISGTVSTLPDPSEKPAVEPHGGNGVLVPLDSGTLRMDSRAEAPDLGGDAPEVNETWSGPEPHQETGVVENPADIAAVPDARTAPPAQAPVEPSVTPPAQAQEPAKPAPLVVTTRAPRNLAPGQKAIALTRLEIEPRSAIFRLSGASELKGKAFVLKDPDRIVLDLDGPWAINLGRTPENNLIKSVRAGNQEAETRIVFDMHRAPASIRLVQINKDTLELRIR